MTKPKALPSLAVLQHYFSYDPETGVITNKVQRSNLLKGSIAGSERPDGYRAITLNRVKYLAHRIAWKLHTGEEPDVFLDHKDRNPSNNAFLNLRNSDPWKNQGNRFSGKNSSTLPGTKRNGRKWVAQSLGNHLGTYDTEAEAHAVYRAWHLSYFGEFSVFAKPSS